MILSITQYFIMPSWQKILIFLVFYFIVIKLHYFELTNNVAECMTDEDGNSLFELYQRRALHQNNLNDMHNYKNRMIAESATAPTTPMKDNETRVLHFFQDAMGRVEEAKECSTASTWVTKTNERIKMLERMLAEDEIAIKRLEMKALSDLADEKIPLLERSVDRILQEKHDALSTNLSNQYEQSSRVYTTKVDALTKRLDTLETNLNGQLNSIDEKVSRVDTILRDSESSTESCGKRCYNCGYGCGKCVRGFLDTCSIS